MLERYTAKKTQHILSAAASSHLEVSNFLLQSLQGGKNRLAALYFTHASLRYGHTTAHITGANKKDPPLGPKTGEGGGAEQETNRWAPLGLRRVFFLFVCCDDDNRRAELFLHLHCCIVTESRSECSLICWGEDTLLLAGARKLERRQCCFQVAIHRSTDLDPSPHGCVLSLSLG